MDFILMTIVWTCISSVIVGMAWGMLCIMSRVFSDKIKCKTYVCMGIGTVVWGDGIITLMYNTLR